jgi:tubulysin polyketide synthase-like protein
MHADTLIESLSTRGFTIRAEGDAVKVSPSSALTAEDRQAIKAHKAELLNLLTSGHLCPGCAGEMRLQDRPRDAWWCPICRRWADGQGRPLSQAEILKPITRDQEEARKLIADLRAAGCAFALEDGELRLRYPSRMSAGLWARFESAGDVFIAMAREAAGCDEPVGAEGLSDLEERQ